MEAISTTQRKKTVQPGAKNQHVWKKPLKNNNIETTIFYKLIPKYTEEKRNIQKREASLSGSDRTLGNIEHSTGATWHVFIQSKRTEEWLTVQATAVREVY